MYTYFVTFSVFYNGLGDDGLMKSIININTKLDTKYKIMQLEDTASAKKGNECRLSLVSFHELEYDGGATYFEI